MFDKNFKKEITVEELFKEQKCFNKHGSIVFDESLINTVLRIDLNNQNLNNIPQSILFFKNLKQLDLSYNNFDNDKSLKLLKKVKKLNHLILKGNKFTNIDNLVEYIPNIETLNLNFNNFLLSNKNFNIDKFKNSFKNIKFLYIEENIMPKEKNEEIELNF